MRVLDIITEAQTPLDILRVGVGATNPFSRRAHSEAQVIAIKTELQRHVLVTNFNQATGQRTVGGRAWVGQIDGIWTDELDSAIIAWKRSINLQLSGTPDQPLQNVGAATISLQDIRYLQDTEVGSDGLLDVGERGDLRRRNAQGQGIGTGETYTPGEIPGTREDVLENPRTSTMVQAVGFSAWYRIASEILESNLSSDGESWTATTPDRERGMATMRLVREAFQLDQLPIPAQWLTNVNRRARRAVATYADGSTQPIAFPSPSPDVVEIFDYYSNMARRLWEKDNQVNAERRATQAQVAANPVSAETIDESSLRVIAAQLQAAFENQLTALLPGGRSFDNDTDAIRDALGRIRTAADFDNLSRIYSEIANGEVLHERLYEELSKEEYMGIVLPRLLAIRRVAPRILFASINFGDQDSVQVRYDGTNYTIMRERGPNNQIVIDNYDGENDYNAIIIDNILRLAVEQSGGNIPDFDTPIPDEELAEVKIHFINTIQATYPEMVAFYVRAEPFNNASVDLGGMRLRGILDDSARMGDNELVIRNYMTEEIKDDRDWLTGTDTQEAAANIYFDERYYPEGIRNRDMPTISADADIELNANEEEIFENLKSTQAAVVVQAVDALLQSDNPAQMWENIYRRSANTNMFLDKAENMGNGQRDVEEFLQGRDPGTPIIRIARTESIGLAIAAPRVCAEMFYEAGRGRRMSTDEDTINALIGQIRNRYDYEMIDERYRALSDDSLIDDLASEQIQGIWGGGWYARLAEIIGDERRLDLIRVELDRGIMDALENVERAPTAENIEALTNVTSRNRQFKDNEDQLEIVLDRLREVLDDLSDDSDSPEGILLSNLINELQETLDNL